MKKILIALLIIPCLLLGRERRENVKWVSYTRTGTTTTVQPQDTMSVLGASDSLLSAIYPNNGNNINLTAIFTGGTTQRVKLIIEGANDDADITDNTYFQPYYWVHFNGLGHDSCYVATKLDSCTKSGTSSGIYVPMLGIGFWRIRAISTAQQSGNTLIEIKATRWEK